MIARRAGLRAPLHSPDHPDHLAAIADRVDHICAALSASQIAALIGGPTSAALRLYLSGLQPNLDFVARLCAALDISADWLLLGRGHPHPAQNARLGLRSISTADLSLELTRRLGSSIDPKRLPSSPSHLNSAPPRSPS